MPEVPSGIRVRLGLPRAWQSGAVYLVALAMCALWVIRNSPIVPADPARASLVMRFTIEDFANITR